MYIFLALYIIACEALWKIVSENSTTLKPDEVIYLSSLLEEKVSGDKNIILHVTNYHMTTDVSFEAAELQYYRHSPNIPNLIYVVVSLPTEKIGYHHHKMRNNIHLYKNSIPNLSFNTMDKLIDALLLQSDYNALQDDVIKINHIDPAWYLLFIILITIIYLVIRGNTFENETYKDNDIHKQHKIEANYLKGLDEIKKLFNFSGKLIPQIIFEEEEGFPLKLTNLNMKGQIRFLIKYKGDPILISEIIKNSAEYKKMLSK